MPRKSKFDEQTDVVSVRLPVSLIERLDGLCRALRMGRAEFVVAVLKRYPDPLTPERARVWLANLVWLFIGGGAALLAALHGGGGVLGESLAPARAANRPPFFEEEQSPFGQRQAFAPPMLPPRDIREERTWLPGDLQGLIPRGRTPPRASSRDKQNRPQAKPNIHQRSTP